MVNNPRGLGGLHPLALHFVFGLISTPLAPRMESPPPDNFGLKLKPTGSSEILVGVFVSGFNFPLKKRKKIL